MKKIILSILFLGISNHILALTIPTLIGGDAKPLGSTGTISSPPPAVPSTIVTRMMTANVTMNQAVAKKTTLQTCINNWKEIKSKNPNLAKTIDSGIAVAEKAIAQVDAKMPQMQTAINSLTKQRDDAIARAKAALIK